MRVEDLAALGLPDEIIIAWRAAGIEELTDIQERCLTDARLLSGENTFIMAPSSAGKTFVAEVLAIRAALALRHVLYVVPFKALAEEKYRYFLDLYGRTGISVAVSSGDRDEFDDDIRRGSYFITVVVNEKLAQLLVQSPGIVADCSLVVFDEVQLIRDATRGPQLEMLLTRLLLAQDRPQIVALSATAGALNRFDKWIGCQVIQVSDRPVPLTELALTQDGRVLSYDRETGEVNLIRKVDGGSKNEALTGLTLDLVQKGHQVLVFRAHVDETQQTAQAISGVLPKTDIPREVIEFLTQLDDSEARSVLHEQVSHGVAYHNAGLSFDERAFVERAFRNGHLRALVSTTTLAMGVNLPADAVIVGDCRRWDPAARGRRVINVGEYKNCAGRAGRLGHSGAGESFLLVESHDLEERMLHHFLSGAPEAIESAIPRSRLIEHVLSAVASRLASTVEEVHRLFDASFAAATFYREQGKEELDAGIDASLARLAELQLIDLDSAGQARSTALGEVVARTGVSVDSGARMIEFLRETNAKFRDADVVFELCQCEEIGTLRPYLQREEQLQPATWRDRVLAMVTEPATASRLDSVLLSGMLPNYDDHAALKRCCLALRWREGERVGVLTREFRIGLGHIRQVAENLAWLLETMAQLTGAMTLPNDLTRRLGRMAQEMHHGVPYEAVPVARLRVPGLRRDDVIRLVRNERGKVFTSLDDVLDAGTADCVGIINPALVAPLQEAILRRSKEGLQRRKAGLLVRARRLSIAEALIKDLFETQGTDFEVAIVNILNAEPFSLGAKRVTRQDRGQADIHVPLPDGGSVVISATSSEDNAKPVSWDKAREVLGAVGVHPPVRNFVVLGKPDFHQLAQQNADEIGQEAGRAILLVPVHLLGDLCLRAFEGKTDHTQMLRIVAEEQGYLTSERLDELTS